MDHTQLEAKMGAFFPRMNCLGHVSHCVLLQLRLAGEDKDKVLYKRRVLTIFFTFVFSARNI